MRVSRTAVITYYLDQVPVVIYELNESAINFIS
jgi:hypothetical protein